MGIKPLGGSFERPPKPNPDIGTCLTFFHIGRLRAKTRQDRMCLSEPECDMHLMLHVACAWGMCMPW